MSVTTKRPAAGYKKRIYHHHEEFLSACVQTHSVPLIFILLVYSLIAARNLLYPLALAVLFSYLLYPVTSWLEKIGVPRILANLMGILLAMIVLSTFLFLLYKQLSLLLDDVPALARQAEENLDSLHRYVEAKLGISAQKQNAWVKERVGDLFTSGSEFIQAAFAATAGTLVKMGLLPVYIFFMLYYRNKFFHFLLMMVPNRYHGELVNSLFQASQVTKRYMSGIVVVVAILCVLNSVGLLIVGVRYAVLLGIIAALINFIPYFGTLIGGAVPLTFSLLMMDSPRYALGVIVLFIIIQFLENNILTPNIVGGNVNINP
ncbi:AI-2E family transporter, partial [Cesiribacter andamanensis]|uniref:AI-2E family transporter n=1 Tax=Cesiribacter andamanensis TaxID=649507 RepID=UPI0021CD5D68